MSTAEILEKRARFIPVEDGFNIKRPILHPASFNAERDRALDAATPTGWILLDRSETLLTPYPATTPLLLAKYGRIRAGESLRGRLSASGEIYYVVSGRGTTSREGVTIDWAAGDIFCLPGGIETAHAADEDPCILFSVTDEPMLAFAKVDPAQADTAALDPVHYPARMIGDELETLYRRDLGEDTPGRALFLTSEKMEAQRTCTPSLTVTLNAVLPGESQPPHRHNAAAIVFITKGGTCHSSIGGVSLPWIENSVLLTPPNALHSHSNTGAETAVALIVQDGGLHYHCRTMGFEFA